METPVHASKRHQVPGLMPKALRLRPDVALIGCGRVGTAIALGLKRAGYRIVWVKDVDPKAERRAAKLLLGEQRAEGKEQRAKSKEQKAKMPPGAEVILIATPDSQIAAAYHEIASALVPGQTLVHFSGAHTSQIIQNPKPKIQNHGVLAMHPVMTFAECGMRSAECGIPEGTFFSLEGNAKGLRVGKRLVRDLGGKVLVLRTEDKPLFHAACVFVSNFLDVLIDAGIEMCGEVGLEPKIAYRVLEPLIRQTLRNIAESGTTQALSGPIERGDIETVRKHLAALTKRRPELVQLYEALAAQTQKVAAKKIRNQN
jgi:predicted short-subunit dehydrogenase-like oxidoreductase (DUF2520 family)